MCFLEEPSLDLGVDVAVNLTRVANRSFSALLRWGDTEKEQLKRENRRECMFVVWENTLVRRIISSRVNVHPHLRTGRCPKLILQRSSGHSRHALLEISDTVDQKVPEQDGAMTKHLCLNPFPLLFSPGPQTQSYNSGLNQQRKHLPGKERFSLHKVFLR